MQASFYILFSKSANKFYIGHTTEPIVERVRKHNSNHDGFTGKFQVWFVVYSEDYLSKYLAHARERKVKAWKSRKKIEQLIAS